MKRKHRIMKRKEVKMKRKVEEMLTCLAVPVGFCMALFLALEIRGW